MDWRDKLKKEIDGLTDEAFQEGWADVYVSVDRSTSMALLSYVGRVNATDLCGMARGHVLLHNVVAYDDHLDGFVARGTLCFSVCKEHAFNHYVCETGEVIHLLDRRGSPLMPYFDFNAV